MARLLNPLTGLVEEIDDSLTDWMDTLWARLDAAQDAPGTRSDDPGATSVSESKQPVQRAAETLSAPHRGPIGTPAWRRRETRLIVPWQPAELGRVRDELPGRYRLMCDIGAVLGLRQGELFGFNVEDLDRRVYRVRVQVKRTDGVLVYAAPKHGRERSAPVPASLHQHITAHTAEHGTTRVTLPWEHPAGPPRTLTLAFTGQHAAPLDRSYVNRLWRTAVLAAGIAWIPQDTGMHMLRHVAASRWISAGADVLMVADLLGHADIATTERYMHRLKTHDQRTRTVVARAQPRAQRPAKLPPGVASLDAWRVRKSS